MSSSVPVRRGWSGPEYASGLRHPAGQCLAVEPSTRLGLVLVRGRVPVAGFFRSKATAAANRHPAVGLRSMVLVELDAHLRCVGWSHQVSPLIESSTSSMAGRSPSSSPIGPSESPEDGRGLCWRSFRDGLGKGEGVVRIPVMLGLHEGREELPGQRSIHVMAVSRRRTRSRQGRCRPIPQTRLPDPPR